MGNTAKPEPRPSLPEVLWCPICYDWLSVKQFRALQCGHYFCITCLEEWSKQELVECPKCRQEDQRSLEWLDDLHCFTGKLYFEGPPDDEDVLAINNMLHMQMIRRSKTVKYLKLAAEEISKIELTGAGVKIGGAVTGLVGTGMLITGAALSLTGFGAVVGVPLAISGGAVGGIGGLAVGGGIIGEAITKNKELTGINEHLQSDYFHSMQIRILVGKASCNEKYASKIGVQVQDALSMLTLLGRVAKFGIAVSPAARAAAVGVARGALTAGAHITGIVIAAVLVPIDIVQIVVSSIKIHKKSKSEVVQEMEKLAGELEDELWSLLKDKKYSIIEIDRFSDDQEKHWLLLAVDSNEINDSINFMEILRNLSICDIEKTYVVLYDSVGCPVPNEVYNRVFDIWAMEEMAQDALSLKQMSISDT